MAISNITNGESGLDVRASLNEAIDQLNAITPTGTSLNTAADAIAAAAVLGSSGGNGSADTGLAALFGISGELISFYELNVYSPDRAAVMALDATGFANLALRITSSAAALSCVYGDETNVFGASLQFPVLSGTRAWSLPDASGTLMLTSAIGVSVQAYSANLTTLSGKSLSGTGALACVTSPTFVTPILGTPTSGTLTNCTGLPVAGVTGLGTMATQAASAVAITGGTATGLTNLGVSVANNTAMTGFALGSISDTTSRPFTISQTWNNAGLTATLFRADVTDTASNAASLLCDLKVGGVSVFKIDKTGSFFGSSYPTWEGEFGFYLKANTTRVAFATSGRLEMMNNAFFGFNSGNAANGSDVMLIRGGAAATLQLGVNHATTATNQTLKAHNVTTGTGAKMCIGGGTGSSAGGAVSLATSATTGALVDHLLVRSDGVIDFASASLTTETVVSDRTLAVRVGGTLVKVCIKS